MSRDGWMRKRANDSDDNGWGERGGYMAAKVSKLDEQFKLNASREKQKEGSSSSIFSGVAIYVNGYTDPSADELRRLMMLHGGQFHLYYSRSKTTHVIASNLPNCKIQELRGEKIIRPEWITESIQAGRLLPYLKYQLYAKQKNTLFPGVILRHTSETPDPGYCPLRPNAHQKPLLPACNTEPSVPRGGGPSNSPYPVPGSDDSEPQSVRSGSKASLDCHPPSHLKPGRVVSGSLPPSASLPRNHLSSQGHVKHPRKSPTSARTDDEDLKINGAPQTSPDTSSHCNTKEMQERRDARPAGASAVTEEAPLTNGHAHLLNGALKPEDSFPVADPSCSDRDRSTGGATSSTEKPQSPAAQSRAKPDPYEFPPSPPKQSDASAVLLEQSSAEEEGEPKPPAPSSDEALKADKPQPPLKPLRPPARVEPFSEPTPRSPASRSLSHSSVRLNGSHRKAEPPAPPADPAAAPAEGAVSSDQLLEQTGGLISEFYSHSRLHQISTWRVAFSEYVNELHSRRKTEGSPFYSGKDRLKKSVAQRPSRGQGSSSSGRVKSCIFHVDMDCFFVSVGIRHRPELKGKPVAVTSNRGLGKVPIRPGANHQAELEYYQRKLTSPQPEGAAAADDLAVTPSQDSPDSRANGVDQDAAALSMAEIASCSYEARQAGVRNGMFFGKAKQLCPALQSVPYDFDAYKEVALNMYEILASYTHDIEALSCDEALIDASSLLAEVGVGPDELAKAIRADIEEKTRCCASVGMGSNILLARLATRKAKPDGQYFLRSEEVDDFIRELPVTSLPGGDVLVCSGVRRRSRDKHLTKTLSFLPLLLPGVGRVMAKKLSVMGVKSCGDLQQVPLSQLQKKFGPRTGQTLFRFCRGLDDRPVRFEKERKSVSADMNYNIRFTTVDEAECFLTNLSMEVQRRLKEAGLRGRRVTLKVMVRKVGAPLEPAKYGGHGICDNVAKTVMLAQSTDSGQLIASAVIKLLHGMKLQVHDLRGVGIQVQQLEGNQPQAQDGRGARTRSIKDMLLGQRSSPRANDKDAAGTSSAAVPSGRSTPRPLTPAEPLPGTSNETPVCRQTPKQSRTRLNFSIEVPSPSQVDRSVLEALPAELREQVEQSWTRRDERPNHRRSPEPPPSSPDPRPALYAPPAGTLVLQFPNQPDSPGIVLELPNISQVDPDVFAALPKELQDELKSAYSRANNAQAQAKTAEQKNPLLQLKQPAAGAGVGRPKRRYKRKNGVSPVKKGASPLKRRQVTNSPAKNVPPTKPQEPVNVPKTATNPSTSQQDAVASGTKTVPRPAPTLAGACDLTDIKTLLREWVTTITDPMEEDILQVVKYCTDLIEDKDLEKLDLVIKYMKRLMQQSVESVWSMAFDFILDNIQVVVHQAYGSVLKIA